jgi:hypothetical protein
VRDWIGDVASEESEQVGRMWTDALLRIAYSIAPTRYSCSANDRVKLLEAIAIMLYDLYDIKEPFLPQLERNIAFLIKHLEEQHSIVVPSVQEYLAISQEVMADVSEGS